jgi:hypothetical protein
MADDEPLEAADERVAERARQEEDGSITLIQRGLTLHMQALGYVVKNSRWEEPFSVLRVTLLTRSFNSCHMAYRSLLWGYHSQALILLRSALDDWLAERYVKSNPLETSKWIGSTLHPPRRLARMRCLGKSERARLQGVFRTLDEFDHPGRLGVWKIVERRPTGGYLRMGGHFDTEDTRVTIAPFLYAISLLHNSLQQLTLDMGLHPEPPWSASAKDFDDDATMWMDRFNAEATDKPRTETLPDD